MTSKGPVKPIKPVENYYGDGCCESDSDVPPSPVRPTSRDSHNFSTWDPSEDTLDNTQYDSDHDLRIAHDSGSDDSGSDGDLEDEDGYDSDTAKT